MFARHFIVEFTFRNLDGFFPQVAIATSLRVASVPNWVHVAQGWKGGNKTFQI